MATKWPFGGSSRPILFPRSELKARFRTDKRCEERSCRDRDGPPPEDDEVEPPERAEIGRAAWRYLHALAAQGPAGQGRGGLAPGLRGDLPLRPLRRALRGALRRDAAEDEEQERALREGLKAL